MAIQYFQPEIWASQLLSTLRKSLVYGGVCNRDYEGEIASQGDTVHITSIADPTISSYTKDTDMSSPQALTDADRTLLVDQSFSFNFQIDDIDAAQVANNGGLMSEAADRAAFGLGDKADQFLVQRLLSGDGTTVVNSLGVVDATTVTNVYDKLIVGARTKLSVANVPMAGRWLVVDPATVGQLLQDSRFIKVNEAGTPDGLRNGLVGRAGGFDIFESNNAYQTNRTGITATTATGVKTITGAAAGTFNQGDVGATITGTGFGASNKVASVLADGTGLSTTVNQSASATVADIALSGGGQVAVAGTRIACTYAEQISKVEAYRPEKRFADALKGLHLYGAKVVRPTALVVSSVKVS